MHFVTLLPGIRQALLVEIDALADIEAVAVFARLVRVTHDAVTLESALAAVLPRAAIRHDVDLRAGLGVLDEVFLGAAIRAVANTDVFPVRGETFALGDAGAAGQGAQQRQGG